MSSSTKDPYSSICDAVRSIKFPNGSKSLVNVPGGPFIVRCNRSPAMKTIRSGIRMVEFTLTDPKRPSHCPLRAFAFNDVAEACKDVFRAHNIYKISDVQAQLHKKGRHEVQLRVGYKSRVHTILGSVSKKRTLDLRESNHTFAFSKSDAMKEAISERSRKRTKHIYQKISPIRNIEGIKTLRPGSTVRVLGIVIEVDPVRTVSSPRSSQREQKLNKRVFRTITICDREVESRPSCVRVTIWTNKDLINVFNPASAIGKAVDVVGKTYLKSNAGKPGARGSVRQYGVSVTPTFGGIKTDPASSSKHIASTELKQATLHTFHCISSAKTKPFVYLNVSQIVNFMRKQSVLYEDSVEFYVEAYIDSISLSGNKTVPWYAERVIPDDPRSERTPCGLQHPKNQIRLICCATLVDPVDKGSVGNTIAVNRVESSIRVTVFDKVLRQLLKCSDKPFDSSEVGLHNLICTSKRYNELDCTFISWMDAIEKLLQQNGVLLPGSISKEPTSECQKYLFRCAGSMDKTTDSDYPDIRILAAQPFM